MTLAPTLDLNHLFKLRLAIARVGEMDNARWWNTKGLLGANGAFVFRRGFARTYPFAQARVAFAVAAARCREWYDVPSTITLWDLGPAVEDRWEERWQDWLDDSSTWIPFFEQIASIQSSDVLGVLVQLSLVGDAELGAVWRLKRDAEERGVPLPVQKSLSNTTVTLLAAAFGHGEPGKLVVPFVSLQQ